MSIEEAENILNEAVITEPSISSYTYISAEEINKAINKILEEKIKNQNRIKELEYEILEQKNKLKKIIQEKEINPNRYPIQKNKIININKYFKKIIKTLLKGGSWRFENR